MSVNWDAIQVRTFSSSDIESYVKYWHDPINSFLDKMGVDRKLLPSPDKMREQLAVNLEGDNPQNSILTIEYAGTAIGVHELTDMKAEDTAVMHAHLWTRDHRGKGIGAVSYLKAMGEYFSRFKLKTIEFRTPKGNSAANKIKDKLGMPPLSECAFSLPILKAPIPAILYVVTADEYPGLVDKFRKLK